jgi:hypothetical protein
VIPGALHREAEQAHESFGDRGGLAGRQRTEAALDQARGPMVTLSLGGTRSPLGGAPLLRPVD